MSTQIVNKARALIAIPIALALILCALVTVVPVTSAAAADKPITPTASWSFDEKANTGVVTGHADPEAHIYVNGTRKGTADEQGDFSFRQAPGFGGPEKISITARLDGVESDPLELTIPAKVKTNGMAIKIVTRGLSAEQSAKLDSAMVTFSCGARKGRQSVRFNGDFIGTTDAYVVGTECALNLQPVEVDGVTPSVSWDKNPVTIAEGEPVQVTATLDYAPKPKPAPKNGVAIVKYVDQAGAEIEKVKQLTGVIGESVTVHSEDIDGYTLTKGESASRTVVFAEETQYVTFTYVKAAAHGVVDQHTSQDTGAIDQHTSQAAGATNSHKLPKTGVSEGMGSLAGFSVLAAVAAGALLRKHYA